MWRTPAANEPGISLERLVDAEGNPPTHWNQRLFDRATGRLAQHGLMQDVLIAGSSLLDIRASHSATQGNGLERMTPGTSGRTFTDSLPDFKTTSRIGWFSRMFVGTSAWGSTVCSMTWKGSATPSGRSLYLLRVSVPSTGGIECGLWPTATVVTRLNEGTARMWATPRTEGFDAGKHRGIADSLHAQVKEMLPTPTSRDHKATGSAGSPSIVRNAERGMLGESAIKESGKTGQKLNPDFVERLMGFPPGWTVLSTSSGADGSTACR
jgi:hypothetical protein